MIKRNKILLITMATLLIMICTPLFGSLYERYFGPTSSGFWGPSHSEYISGFFMSYAFFVSLFATVFSDEKKYKIGGSLLGFLFFINIMLGTWEDLIINIGVVAFGWLLAQGVLLVKGRKYNRI